MTNLFTSSAPDFAIESCLVTIPSLDEVYEREKSRLATKGEDGVRLQEELCSLQKLHRESLYHEFGGKLSEYLFGEPLPRNTSPAECRDQTHGAFELPADETSLIQFVIHVLDRDIGCLGLNVVLNLWEQVCLVCPSCWGSPSLKLLNKWRSPLIQEDKRIFNIEWAWQLLKSIKGHILSTATPREGTLNAEMIEEQTGGNRNGHSEIFKIDSWLDAQQFVQDEVNVLQGSSRLSLFGWRRYTRVMYLLSILADDCHGVYQHGLSFFGYESPDDLGLTGLTPSDDVQFVFAHTCAAAVADSNNYSYVELKQHPVFKHAVASSAMQRIGSPTTMATALSLLTAQTNGDLLNTGTLTQQLSKGPLLKYLLKYADIIKRKAAVLKVVMLASQTGDVPKVLPIAQVERALNISTVEAERLIILCLSKKLVDGWIDHLTMGLYLTRVAPVLMERADYVALVTQLRQWAANVDKMAALHPVA